jgi:DNA-directed RNA polymerase specialized sigma24 family protein
VAAAGAARESYGRLVALLAASTRDIALAEDALADAFERALRTWPNTGVPDNPQGWLMTVARNRIRDLFASAAVRTAAPLDDDSVAATLDDPDPDAIPDKRLELLFACAHPAIDPAVRTPLMLQVVLGFDADRIARVFAVQPPRWHSAWSGRSAASATPASRSACRRAGAARTAARRARSHLRRVCNRLARPARAHTRIDRRRGPVARRAHREPARHRA